MTTLTTGRATDFITFSRTSNATVTDSDGRIKWAGHNLLTNSESFDAASWTKTNLVTTNMANVVVAPNGTTTADQLVASTANDQHVIDTVVNVTGGVQYTIGVFAKAGAEATIIVGVVQRASGSYLGQYNVTYNMSTQSGSAATNGATPPTNNSYSVTPLSNGWFYISVTSTLAATANTCSPNLYLRQTSAYAGNGTDGLYVWGAHLYRSDLGGMVLNPARGDAYYPTTPPNLIGYSEDWTNAAWVKSGISAFGSGSIANAIIAPNGLQTADLIVPTAVSATHSANQTITYGSTVVAFSVYAKAGGYNYAVIQINDAVSNGAGASFDLSTGTIVGNVTTGTWTVASKSISSAGNGWYRISVVINATGTTRKFECEPRPTNSTSWAVTFTGDGTSGIYLWGAQLSDSASLDAYSPVYGAAVTSAAYYAPRLDYSGSSLAALGLLVEEQRTNLLRHTNAFTTAPWQALDGATLAQDQVGPDGVANSAWTVTDSNASAGSSIFQPYSVANDSKLYVGSLFFKKTTAAASFPSLTVNILGGSQAVVSGFTINTNTGVATASTSNQGPTATCVVTDYGTYWRVEIRTANNSTGNLTLYFQCFAAVNTTGNGVFNNATTGSTVIYGAQLEEAASFATSYIPNGAATSGATRTADVASVSTQAFPYSSTEGTLVVSALKSSLTAGDSASATLFTSVNDVIEMYVSNANSRLYGATGGASFSLLDSNKIVAGSVFKSGVAFKQNDYALITNGGTALTDTTANVPVVTTLGIGSRSGNVPFRGWIRQITYIPRRLSNAELQARTL